MNTDALILSLKHIADQASVNAEDIQQLSNMMELQKSTKPFTEDYYSCAEGIKLMNKRMIAKQDIAIQLLAIIKDLIEWK